ncbi:MAG: hypothetical protein CMJ65_18455 [Planctomycetaceae bacterium]|nr:hypothetical protein [Planctomycetaceae bacterium]MDP7275882.1 hypothetical protein [Planctomycetaceae bacterium]
MNRRTIPLLLVLACSLPGCVTPLSSVQKSEYGALAARGMIVEEKDPKLAAALGILPGGGSFYTGEIGLGIVNLAAWPYSILWDPISGADAARKINFYATLAALEARREKEIKQLDRQLEDGQMDQAIYLKRKREIEDKYSVDSGN